MAARVRATFRDGALWSSRELWWVPEEITRVAREYGDLGTAQTSLRMASGSATVMAEGRVITATVTSILEGVLP